jgi:hypothetical protein
MNGKQSKLIRKWCAASWNASTDDERNTFTSLNHYTHFIKEKCKTTEHFKKFVAWSLTKHFNGGNL